MMALTPKRLFLSLSASLSLFSALTLSSHAHLWSLKLSLKMRVSSNELTDDGVDAETSLSLFLHLYLSSPPLHFILTLTFGQ